MSLATKLAFAPSNYMFYFTSLAQSVIGIPSARNNYSLHNYLHALF